MKKLTDQEFREMRAAMVRLEQANAPFYPEFRTGLRKLLANYQEQLETESYVAAERYTEANACTATLDCNVQVAP